MVKSIVRPEENDENRGRSKNRTMIPFRPFEWKIAGLAVQGKYGENVGSTSTQQINIDLISRHLLNVWTFSNHN